MKYKVTNVVEKEAKLDTVTEMAVFYFGRAVRAEKRLEKAEAERDYWAGQVPEKDMLAYVEITNEMENDES